MISWMRNHFHQIWRLLLIALLGLGVLGLYALPIKVNNRPIRIIAIGKAPAVSTAFWWSVKSGMEAAAQEYGDMVDYWSPTDESRVDEQIALLRQAIAQKPDIILLAALDKNRLVEPAREARAAGIRLLMFDSSIESSGSPVYDSFIATDNVAAGEKLGDKLLELLPRREKVLIVSPSTRGDSLIGRETGVRNRIEGHYDILPTVDVHGSFSNDVFSKISQILEKQTDIGGIVCLNEYTTVGASRAVLGAGLAGKIRLVGFDSSEELINYIESGLLSGVVIQRPFNMGYLSVVCALDVLAGKPTEPFYDTGSIVITKDTIYEKENEKLLFPFE